MIKPQVVFKASLLFSKHMTKLQSVYSSPDSPTWLSILTWSSSLAFRTRTAGGTRGPSHSLHKARRGLYSRITRWTWWKIECCKVCIAQ